MFSIELSCTNKNAVYGLDTLTA